MSSKKEMLINLHDRKAVIRPQLYGHFIEQTSRVVNNGLFVGKNSTIPNRDGVRLDVIEAWKDMGVSLLHWPGGITSEGYEWRKGVGDRVPNINSPVLGVDDPNDFGTDEFMNLCEYLGCDAYIVSGTLCTSVKDLRDWIQYITASKGSCEMSRFRERNGHALPWKLPYVCIGNEWWFTDSASTYAEKFARYRFAINDLMGLEGRVEARPKIIGIPDRAEDRPKIITRGPHIYNPATTAELVSKLRPGTYDAIGFYVVARPQPFGSPSISAEQDYYIALKKVQNSDQLIDTQIGIIRSRPENANVRLSIDEWGTWYEDDPEWLWKQSVTLRDVIAVSQQLDIFNKHANDIEVACIAMSVNVLCCSVMADGDRFFRTPVYDVLKLYRSHQGAQLLGSWVEESRTQEQDPNIYLLSHTASVKDGKLQLTVSNASVNDTYDLNVTLYGGTCSDGFAQIVTGDLMASNSFDCPDAIRAKDFRDFDIHGDHIRLVLPPLSLVYFEGTISE